jgi:pimeloyl-ACP methyl ester carboxylesterase
MIVKVQVRATAMMVLCLVAAPSPVGTAQIDQLWTDRSGHAVSFVTVSPGVDLEVLDWGGTGPSLLLLSGVGNTAHVYDEFALRLTGPFRVVGVTRRGFGASGRSATGHDINSRVQDILTVIDRLGFEHPVMVGHSIAGEEMTRFAASHPSRIRAIVYLDAAYDHTQTPQVPGPDQPMTARDKETVDQLNDWLARTLGHRYPEAEIRSTGGIFDSTGRFIRDVTPSGAGRQVLNSVERPDYRAVRVPTLAIYRPMTLRSLYPNADSFDAPARELAERQAREARIWWQRSIDQYRGEATDARAVLLESGGHHVFLTNADEVARLTLSFLADLSVP